MKANDMFCWNRFSNLLINTIREEKKSIILSTLVSGAILFAAPLIILIIGRILSHEVVVFNIEKSFFYGLSACLVILLTLLKAADAFPEKKNKERAAAFLMLPASVFEKVLSRYLLYSAGLTIFAVAVCVVFVCLTMAVASPFVRFVPIKGEITVGTCAAAFLGLLFFQGFFFLGGVYFKTNPFLKTGLFLVIFHYLLYCLFSYLLLGNPLAYWDHNGGDGGHAFIISINGFYECVLAVVCYGLCLATMYFRVKELEVDEI